MQFGAAVGLVAAGGDCRVVSARGTTPGTAIASQLGPGGRPPQSSA